MTPTMHIPKQFYIQTLISHEPDKARFWCYNQLRKNPNDISMYRHMAECFNLLHQYDSMIRSYQVIKNIDESSFHFDDHLSLGNALSNCGQTVEALDTYEAISKKEIVLVFSPDVNVHSHFHAQCILAKVLNDQGICTVMVPCSEIFHPFLLPSIDQSLEWFNSDNTLYHNQYGYDFAQRSLVQYRLPSLNIKAFWDEGMTSRLCDLMSSCPQNPMEFWFEGINFGGISTFDLALLTKIYDFRGVSASVEEIWKKYIEHNLIAYFLTKKIYEVFKIKSAIHYNDYSPMLVHRIVGERNEVSIFTVTQSSHIGVDRRRFNFFSRMSRLIAEKQVLQWPRFRDLALQSEIVLQVGDDILFKFGASGSHVYSPKKSLQSPVALYESLQLDSKKSLLVAYTSSNDEVVSILSGIKGLNIDFQYPPQPFSDQVDWLQQLTDWVESRSNLQLIVRIHPRESRNHRDSQISQHLNLLIENFDRPFVNCRFIWPEDPISSYDLAEIADLVLTSWSSMGLECARLGIPVLTATNGIAPFPHDDFLEWGQTPQQYFQKVTELLSSSPSLSRIALAFRWYHLYHLGISLDLSDLIPSPDFTGLPEFQMPREAKTIEDIIIHGKDILEINCSRLEAAQSSNSGLLEEQAIIQQLCRIFHFIFTGQDDLPSHDTEVKFQYIPQASSLEDLVNWAAEQVISCKDRGAAFVGQQGGEVFYIDPNGQALQRYSPLCTRLIPLIVS
jgi:tetratricopeptide (TPR) repeat protein